uniref:Phospholipase/carboxylesterase/thioesterase domain-containing protein n=1 Tax=Anaerolinea thermolimosa TaxID=229919 RepID=A0A7C4PKK9_9CHLR
MPTGNDTLNLLERGWVFRLRLPQQKSPARTVVMIHGWTGDETSMEVFSRALPQDSLIIYPRAPLPAHPSGFGWVEPREEIWPTMQRFEAVCQDLVSRLDSLLDEIGLPHSRRWNIAGFSQGGAMCYALGYYFPGRLEKIAVLSGYFPEPDPQLPSPNLSGLSFFIAHGSRDETVPSEQAIRGLTWLKKAGARVIFCESPVGHRVSTDCMKGFQGFLTP